MSVTIKDVARSCGLSISTVSKVFNGYPDISELTRRQVMEAAREIGYKPNALARALKTNRSFNLGVLFVDDNISGLMHPFFAAVLNAFKAEAERQGYDITFINHNIGTMEMTYLEHCRYRNVDGVCLACVDFYSNEGAELTASTIPCVTIDHLFEGCPSIISDNLNGIHLLVDRAVALGHKRIAYIHGQRNSLVTENRIKGFYRAMEYHGLSVPEAYVRQGRYDDAEDIHGHIRALLALPLHAACGVYMGIAYGQQKVNSLYKPASFGSVARACLITPVLIHGFYDFCAFMQTWVFTIVFIVFVALVFIFTLKQLKKASREDGPVEEVVIDAQ